MDTIDYRIPKVEIKSDIAIDNGVAFEEDEYIMFLDKISRYRHGEETVFEFLSKKKGFIPLKKSSSGEFIIVNMDDIAYIREKEKNVLSLQRQIKLYMKNNLSLELGHINPLPDSQSRVLDYLNQDSLFLLFYQEDQKIFINKSKIIKVIEKSGKP